jgi:hypothetical protein
VHTRKILFSAAISSRAFGRTTLHKQHGFEMGCGADNFKKVRQSLR